MPTADNGFMWFKGCFGLPQKRMGLDVWQGWDWTTCFVIDFQNKTAGNLHCSFSCEAPGSPSSQPAHSADPTPASPSPAAWQTTRLLIMHVNTRQRQHTIQTQDHSSCVTQQYSQSLKLWGRHCCAWLLLENRGKKNQVKKKGLIQDKKYFKGRNKKSV